MFLFHSYHCNSYRRDGIAIKKRSICQKLNQRIHTSSSDQYYVVVDVSVYVKIKKKNTDFYVSKKCEMGNFHDVFNVSLLSKHSL